VGRGAPERWERGQVTFGRSVEGRELRAIRLGDPHRNFPVGWSDREPRGSGYYGGQRPFSEP
jgi:hypothetical protein